MAAQGAHILDVGGESTRPFADPVPAEEELARVLPVIKGLGDTDWSAFEGAVDGGPVISVDTYKASVASAALDAGALIVNDVSACRFDPALADVVGERKPGYVLMHSIGKPGEMQIDPRYDDVVDEILAFFEEHVSRLTAKGLPEKNIVLDPGIGFGKLLEHNISILKNIDRFRSFGLPLFMGLSNKSVWGGLLGLEAFERGLATAVATALAAFKGAAVHRVHDVAAARQALTISAALA